MDKSKDPLHGITLEHIIIYLQEQYGWEGLADRMRVNCFHFEPSVNSCLKFFRKTPWARKKIEDLYINTINELNQSE